MAHVHEKIDFVVSVFIIYQDKVLLRWHDKYPFWLAIGGHVELDEDPNQAALREVKEEVGLDVVLWDGNKRFQHDFSFTNGEHHELIPPIAVNRHSTSSEHEHIDLVYFAKTDTDVLVLENEKDICRWTNTEEIKSIELLDDVRFYANLAIETLGGNQK